VKGNSNTILVASVTPVPVAFSSAAHKKSWKNVGVYLILWKVRQGNM
jgi:hypothetical protein